jgi:RNA polymerase sigma-70 factor (ECF subfamily)
MAEYDKNNPMTTLSDSLLLQRITDGDKASFEVLFYRHYDRVYGLLFRILGNRVEAEDVTQELFLKLYRRPLPGKREHNLNSWLYRVATNMAYNQIRSRKRRWGRNRWLVPDSSDERGDPGEGMAREETRSAVREALRGLPQRQTQLLILREMGFSYAELAEACDVKPGSVGTLLGRAAEAFRKAYRDEFGDSD